MIIGCPTEIKTREHRIGIIPASVFELTAAGHTVLVQSGAGNGSGISDDALKAAGAKIVATAADVWSTADLVCKVKEPLAPEFPLMREGQILFTYLHLAAAADLTRVLVDRRVTAIAYETIQVGHTLPLLKPMSEVAGKMSVQVGAWCLEREHGGKGVLLGGVPGVPRGRVVVIGGGVVGMNAAKVAVGMGADVTIVDNSLERLEYLEDVFLERAQTLYSTKHSIAEQVQTADLVIGAVLVAGARAPRLVTRELLGQMQPGSVIVDVAVDQGGCVETMRVTTHDAPTFVVDGVVHYGVANMPGAVPRTSTFALNHATFPYLKMLVSKGFAAAVKASEPLAKGVNTYQGHVTYEAVAESLGIPFTPLDRLAGGQAHIDESATHRLLIVTHDQRKGRGELHHDAPFPTSHVEMHTLLVRMEFLQRRPDLFDPAIPSIPENVDFCLGIQAMGGSIWMDPRAVVTIVLPKKIPEADRSFYLTRWSQESQLRGLARFREKWNLHGRQPVLESQLRWAVAHRVVARRFSLHRLLGIASDSILNRRLLAPLEHRLLGA